MTHKLQDLIELAWEGRAQITAASAPDAVIDTGVQRVFGWYRPGPIRALP